MKCTASLALMVSLVQASTPVEKVTELLEGMHKKLKEEGENEAATYATFSCFCKETSTQKSASIKSGEGSINLLSAELGEKTQTKAEKTTELQEAKTKREQLTADLQATQVRCDKERAEYDAKNADLVKALDSLKSAIASMESSKPKAGLLTVRRAIATNPAFTEAMKLVDAGPKWESFLQVDPTDPEYKYHSHGIISIMNDLNTDFTKQKEDHDAEFAKSSKACSESISGLEKELEQNAAEIEGLEGEIASLATRLAAARGELVEADDMMKEDKLYLTDLTSLCETRANQFDQRSQMRGKELEALSQALEVLASGVAPVESKRAMLLAKENRVGKQSASANQRPLGFLQRASVREHEQDGQRLGNTLQLLQREATRLNSGEISAMLARAGSDPFLKVKTLIQKLVERLIQEATAEATKKGFCDTALGKAKKSRDFRLAEAHKLSAEIGELDAKEDALSLEIDELANTLKNLATSSEEAAKMRAQEKEENAVALADARGGLEAVTVAIGILKTFYKEAAKAAAMVQVHVSPVAADNPGAGFDGAYSGNQAESKGVVGLLEVIKTDFEHTIEVTEATEKQQSADYVKFDRTNQADTGSKNTKDELDKEDLETTRLNLEQKHADLTTNMNLVDDALKEIEALAPSCIDNVMSYADRVAKREEEIAALNKALCQLGGDC